MSKPNYTEPLPVSDAGEADITVKTYCNQVVIFEQSSAAGWPRAYLLRGSVGGSAQITMAPGSSQVLRGSYAPGDKAGTIELVSRGGDTSSFAVQELQ